MLTTAVTASAVIAAGFGLYGWHIEPRRFQLRCRDIELPGYRLPPLTVLQLSDFHFFNGMEYRRDYLRRLAENVQPDLIFITGDLIDDNSGIDLALEAVSPFRAKHGVYCVLGNHDHVHVSFRHMFHSTGSLPESAHEPNDITRLVSGLRELGVTVLRNERIETTIGATSLTIAGIDDPYLRKDDIPKTFAGWVKRGPCLALAHAPERYVELAEAGVDAVFCGHTHGGQIRLPGYGPIITRSHAPRRFVDGLTRENGTVYHTSRGLGSSRYSRPRLFCPPEAHLITLRFNSQP